jgi:hypothetical protein
MVNEFLKFLNYFRHEDTAMEDEIHEKSRDDLEDFEPPEGKTKMTGGVKTLCKPIDKN